MFFKPILQFISSPNRPVPFGLTWILTVQFVAVTLSCFESCPESPWKLSNQSQEENLQVMYAVYERSNAQSTLPMLCENGMRCYMITNFFRWTWKKHSWNDAPANTKPIKWLAQYDLLWNLSFFAYACRAQLNLAANPGFPSPSPSFLSVLTAWSQSENRESKFARQFWNNSPTTNQVLTRNETWVLPLRIREASTFFSGFENSYPWYP